MASKVINLNAPATSKTKGKGRSKSASPTPSSTSIIDSILKERSTSEPKGPGKKLILDLNKDNFILTDARPENVQKPQPIKPIVNKPIDPVVIDLAPVAKKDSPKESSKKKTQDEDDETANRKTPAGSLGNTKVSREKMDKMKALDAVFLSGTPSPVPGPASSQSLPAKDPLDFIFNEPMRSSPNNQTKSIPTSISRTQTPISSSPTPALSPSLSPSVIPPYSNQQKLDTVNRNILKIQTKIKEKGAKEKYTTILKDLEKQKEKYEARLAANNKSNSTSRTPSPQPKNNQPSFSEFGNVNFMNLPPPPTYKESVSKIPEQIEVSQPVNQSRTTSPQIKKLNDDEKEKTDKELARIKNIFDKSKTQPTKEVKSLFNVSNNIETLKEKQRHLEQQHKQLEEKYAHKLKQIERMRNQKEEMTKLSALEQERRKIYEMEQKIKRLDKEQWEEQQRLRRELQTINMTNLNTISSKNNKEVGEFYSLKQSLNNRQTKSSNVAGKESVINKFKLTDWLSGFIGGVGTAANLKVAQEPASKKQKPAEYKPEIFDITRPILPGNKSYQYYNQELPALDWQPNEQDQDWQDYKIGQGQLGDCFIKNINNCLGAYTKSETLEQGQQSELQPPQNKLEKTNNQIEQIHQLSQKLGVTNDIYLAKGLDFLVEKLLARTEKGQGKNAKLLGLIVSMLGQITSGMEIILIPNV